MRSLIPEHVNVMALTATATKVTRRAVCQVLGITSAVIAQIPDRLNIKYSVHANPGSLEEAFAPLVEEIKNKRTTMDRVIIYCRTYDDCSMIYLFLKSRLEGEITEPKNAIDLVRYLYGG